MPFSSTTDICANANITIHMTIIYFYIGTFEHTTIKHKTGYIYTYGELDAIVENQPCPYNSTCYSMLDAPYSYGWNAGRRRAYDTDNILHTHRNPRCLYPHKHVLTRCILYVYCRDFHRHDVGIGARYG
jgi:hypothetical protein